MTATVDALIDRYLGTLAAELAGLPAARRQEILDQVAEHIAQARAGLDADSVAAVRTVLERLGDPADIAAEARERLGVPPAPARPASRALEVAALVALVIPFLGWVVGTVLVWLSRRWTVGDKLVGTVGGLGWVAAGLGTLTLSAKGPTPVGSEVAGPAATDPLAVVLFVVPFLLPLAAAVYLAVRLRAQPAAR